MNIQYLKRSDKEELIIFFSGWGIESYSFLNIPSKSSILFISDYSKLDNINTINNYSANYKKITVISWSFGVLIYSIIKEELKFKSESEIAINGTLKPIDDRYGIPEKIFDKTLINLNQISINQFYSNMFNNEADSLRFLSNNTSRDLNSLNNELSKLKNYANNHSNITNNFNKVIISKQDKIIRFQNQLRFWDQRCKNISIIDSGHFPFYLWNQWEDILES